MIADLNPLLTALYVELTDRIIPARGLARRGPGRPPEVTDAELACLAVAQVLLRHDGERHWLRAAPGLVGTCSRGCWPRASTTPPVPCGTSAVTARHSDLFGYAGYGYCASHSRWYWAASCC
jgi:hypothetical protein